MAGRHPFGELRARMTPRARTKADEEFRRIEEEIGRALSRGGEKEAPGETAEPRDKRRRHGL